MPYIYGQLIAAQLENATTDYAGTVTGAVWLRTDTDKVKIAKNSLVRDILVNDDKLVVGNNGTASLNIRMHRGASTLLQFVSGSDTTVEGTLSTALAQISAKHENYTTAGRPAPGNPGRLIWNTDLAKLQVDDSTTWQDVASGSGTGGGASGIESLAQKLENEKYSILTEPLDNSVGTSGFPAEDSKQYTATLLKDHASAVSTLEVVWNALSPNESDKNMDSTTGWTVTGAGATLTATSTAGEFQVGTAALKFDKNASATEAAIRYDIGSQTKQLNSNSRVWVYAKLPSITDLSNVLLRIYADSTSNFQTFTTTTDYAGNALAIGWNLLLFDISTGGTPGGTGWDITKLSRYPAELGVTTGNAAQTYTGIIFDSCYFSYYRPQEIAAVGYEFTLFNNSTKEDVTFTAANTRHDGPLALAVATSNAYSGGASGTARGRVARTTLASVGDKLLPFDNDTDLSGAITTAQEIRMTTFSRATLSGDLDTVVDMIAVQAAPVTVVGGSTIDISDPGDQSANYLNGDTVDVFRVLIANGKKKYILRAALTLTANASHLSGVTTLTLTTTGIAVGDIVVKRHVAVVSHSVVAEAAAESFSASSLLSAPNGVQLIDDGMAYPNDQYVYTHWLLGGASAVEAAINRKGTGPSLTIGGSLNTANTFKNGQTGTNGWSGSNVLYVPSADQFSADSAYNTRIQFSWWFYASTLVSGGNIMISHEGGSDNSYNPNVTSTGVFRINRVAGTPLSTGAGAIVVGAWNHIVMILQDGGLVVAYVNGIKYVSGATVDWQFASIRNFNISGYGNSFLTPIDSPNIVADVVTWRNGPELTSNQVLDMYNAGYSRRLGSAFRQRYRYTDTGVAGQKISAKINLSRSTTGITPTLWKAGTIVT